MKDPRIITEFDEEGVEIISNSVLKIKIKVEQLFHYDGAHKVLKMYEFYFKSISEIFSVFIKGIY